MTITVTKIREGVRYDHPNGRSVSVTGQQPDRGEWRSHRIDQQYNGLAKKYPVGYWDTADNLVVITNDWGRPLKKLKMEKDWLTWAEKILTMPIK